MFDLTLNYLPEDKVVHVVTLGEYDWAANQKLVAEGLAFAQQHQARLFLIDHRQVRLKLRVMDLSDIPKANQKLGLLPSYLIALLVPSDPEELSKFQFLEDLSALSGIQRRVFTDEAQAMQWLRDAPTGQ